MENERNQCKECGGKGTPSKGIMNFHNRTKSYLKGEVEFETKILDCIKCESCGHSWIPEKEEKSTRQQALEWWNNLPTWGKPLSKEYLVGLYFSDDLITNERIEEIYKARVLKQEPNPLDYNDISNYQKDLKDYKSKQFNVFNPELFKSYINKFSDKHKHDMLQILLKDLKLDKTVKFNVIES